MKRELSKVYALLLAFALVISYAFPTASVGSFAYAGSSSDSGQQAAWYDSIPDMLASGDYVEGVVIAGIDMSKAKKTGDPGSALETKKLRAGAEELISVDPEAALTEEEFGSWLEEHKSKLAEDNDGVCITSISRKGMTTEQILKLLASDDSIVFAEPNYTVGMKSQEGSSNADADNTSSGTAATDLRDVSSIQWSSAENTALHAASKAGDVSAKVPGWPDGSNMDHEIIVAVMDLPVDFSNPDLTDRAYTFTPELKEKLGCDDHGFNATWDSTTGGKLYYAEGADHGTHVAGIVGASWDGKGISGVGSNVRIISVQNSNEGSTSVIDSLRGMNFIKEAVENGVDIRIVNNSWAVDQSSKAIDAAVTELGSKYGVINIFAAGNSAEDLNIKADSNAMMANNPYAIIVASTDPAGDLADSSCYGKGVVDLGAPGAGILSCLQTNSAQYIPVLTENNKVYEDFENGGKDGYSVRVCQIGYYADSEGELHPDPADEIGGADVSVVSGSKEMGFEGENTLKININKSKLGGYNGNTCAVKIDFGDVSKLGVTSGDSVGFAYGGIKEIEVLRTVDTSSGSLPEMSFFAKSNANCFNTHSYVLAKGIDTKNLSIIFEFNAKDIDEIYLDTFGIGNEMVPYGFKSGTSMAAPAVTGAAAVIASRHYDELPSGDAASAEKLANLVRSSVRPLASLKDLTNTGGIIDLTVDANATAPGSQPGPDITDIAVSGSKVTLTGTGFGSTKGTVTARKYVAGAAADIGSTVTSWSDTSTSFTLAEDFEGIIEAELAASNGKKDTIVRFISKSSNVFEKDHNFGSSAGDPFEYNVEPEKMGDLESTGLLVAGDSKLYYMPQTGQVEDNPSFRYLYCYDPGKDSWTACPSCPSWISNVSAAWFNGKLYVKGALTEVDESGQIPYYDADSYEPGTAVVYSYAPGSSGWKKCSAKGVGDEMTLFAAGSRLMLAGTTDKEHEDISNYKYPSVRDYDPAKGAGKPLGYSPCSVHNPKAICTGGYIYLFEYDMWNTLYVLDENLSATNADEIKLPEFYFGAASDRRLDEENYLTVNDFSLAAYGDTLILTGGVAKDGSTDIFLLKAGEKKFKPYGKRVSDTKVIMPSAAVMNDRLYVIGSSDYEPDRRVFRSSLIKDLKQKTPVSIKDAKVVLEEKSLTYNGKVRKPYIKTIGGRLLTEGVDYTVKFSKASPKNVGSYTVTIKGKGDYKGTTKVTYKIRPRGTGIKGLKKAKKAVTVTWSRQSKKMSKSRITGYQIQLATDKAFTKNKRTVTVKGYKNTSRKITKLKAGKKYYVRVRTYKKLKSGKYYSKWSKVKTVKTR